MSGCKECDYESALKPDLMKHIKSEHPKSTPRCRNYVQGKCELNDASCWFIHKADVKDANKEEVVEEGSPEESDFHRAHEKTPPDQVTILRSMIEKISLQVEMLSKRTEKME